jgi:hypothetical protein
MPPPSAGLAGTLARAMEERRQAIKDVEAGDAGGEDDEWSDDEQWGEQ